MKLKKIPFNLPMDSKEVEAFVTDIGLGIIKSTDNTPKWGYLKHVSISHSFRYPTWEEILEVKNVLFGDIDVMMVMPKQKNYINIHPNCFHLWQMPEDWDLQ